MPKNVMFFHCAYIVTWFIWKQKKRNYFLKILSDNRTHSHSKPIFSEKHWEKQHTQNQTHFNLKKSLRDVFEHPFPILLQTSLGCRMWKPFCILKASLSLRRKLFLLTFFRLSILWGIFGQGHFYETNSKNSRNYPFFDMIIKSLITCPIIGWFALRFTFCSCSFSWITQNFLRLPLPRPSPPGTLISLR